MASVPVDSSLTRLTVSVSGTLQGTPPTVTLTRPDGVVVTAATASSFLGLSSGTIISIDNPARGAWTLAYGFVAGPGVFETTLTRPDLFGDPDFAGAEHAGPGVQDPQAGPA